MSGTLQNEHIKAILVGVSDYSAYAHTADLPLSSNDVELMGRALVQGLRINPFHIWVNTSDSGTITRESFLEGIRMFLRDIKPDDILIFYFSGHGTVVKGKHYLLFSDGPLETQSVIDMFSELNVEKRVLFLDSCMSGQYVIDRVNVCDESSADHSDWMDRLLSGGTAVFASSRPEERSGYNTEFPASLFTTFLWNAMTNRFYLQRGMLTLDRIRELVYQDADAWNERHPDRKQHPVFRSSMGGTISFQAAEYKTYEQKQFALERKDYIITEVKPLHSQIAKRYAVKVILKHAVTETELIRINAEIVRTVRGLNIYKSVREENRWKKRPANLVFIYYGHSVEDVAQGLYEFHTTWADETQNKEYWYRTNSHSKVSGGILIDTNPSYEWLQKMHENNSAEEETVIRETKELMEQLIGLGERTVRVYQEYINGMLSLSKMRQELRDTCCKIDRLFIAASDFPVPPPELTKWSLLASDVAGDISDFSCVLFGGSKRTGNAEGAKAEREEADQSEIGRLSLMNDVVRRFHRDLEKLREEEKCLISQGLWKE